MVGLLLAGTLAAPLTLTDLLALVAKEGDQVRMAEARLAQTEAGTRELTSRLWPTVSMTAGANHQEFPGSAPLPSGLNNSAFIGFQPGNTYSTNINLSQPLFDAFATGDTIKIQQMQEAIALWDIRAIRQSALLQAGSGYFDWLRALAARKVAQTEVDHAQDLLNLAEKRLKLGVGTKAEVLQARAALDMARGAWIETKGAEDVSRMRMGIYVKRDVSEANPDEATRLPELPEPAAGTPEGRPEWQKASLAIKAAEMRESLESRALLPTLSGVARWGLQGNASSTRQDAVVGVQANWTPFDGFKTDSRVQAAKSQTEQARLQQEELRQTLWLDVQRAFSQLRVAKEQVVVNRSAVASAQEAETLARRRYELGVGSLMEAQDAVVSLARANRALSKTLIDVEAAKFSLAHAMGVDLMAFAGTP